jgi:hypothetical protein
MFNFVSQKRTGVNVGFPQNIRPSGWAANDNIADNPSLKAAL